MANALGQIRDMRRRDRVVRRVADEIAVDREQRLPKGATGVNYKDYLGAVNKRDLPFGQPDITEAEVEARIASEQAKKNGKGKER